MPTCLRYLGPLRHYRLGGGAWPRLAGLVGDDSSRKDARTSISTSISTITSISIGIAQLATTHSFSSAGTRTGRPSRLVGPCPIQTRRQSGCILSHRHIIPQEPFTCSSSRCSSTLSRPTSSIPIECHIFWALSIASSIASSITAHPVASPPRPGHRQLKPPTTGRSNLGFPRRSSSLWQSPTTRLNLPRRPDHELLRRHSEATPPSSRLPLHRSPPQARRFSSVAEAATSSAVAGTMFEDYETPLKGKYPGKAHAKRVVEQIRKSKPNANGVIYLEGRMTKLQEDNDSPEPFRQRRYFYYLTGCNAADCAFAFDIQSEKSTLFIPPIDPDDVIWSGLPLSIDDALKKYDVDEVKFTTEVNATLTHLAKQNPNSTVFAIANQVSENIALLEFAEKDLNTVKTAIEVSRVIKDEYEVAMIAKANKIASHAHRAVIDRAKTAETEQELYATFLERCVSDGAPEMPYHPILAAGRAAATLHYVDNTAPLKGKLNLLIDAGCEWNNYASDITRTFPLTGKFTQESRDIYKIVRRMQKECTERIKGGMIWDDLHLHAHRVAIDGLLELGVLKGNAQEILDARTSAAFFPHGLGHHLGMDTHDTGGNPNPNDKDKLFRYLRLRGRVPAGAVVTVEPGIYFCEFIIKPYLDDPVHSKYIDVDVLNKYWDVGGVRIEDNIYVSENGYENLTVALKELSEIEAAAS